MKMGAHINEIAAEVLETLTACDQAGVDHGRSTEAIRKSPGLQTSESAPTNALCADAVGGECLDQALPAAFNMRSAEHDTQPIHVRCDGGQDAGEADPRIAGVNTNERRIGCTYSVPDLGIEHAEWKASYHADHADWLGGISRLIAIGGNSSFHGGKHGG